MDEVIYLMSELADKAKSESNPQVAGYFEVLSKEYGEGRIDITELANSIYVMEWIW